MNYKNMRMLLAVFAVMLLGLTPLDARRERHWRHHRSGGGFYYGGAWASPIIEIVPNDPFIEVIPVGPVFVTGDYWRSGRGGFRRGGFGRRGRGSCHGRR